MKNVQSFALNTKQFNAKLANAKIAGKSFRQMVQELILAGFAQYESHAQTEQLSSVYQMSKGLTTVNTKQIKTYIESFANVTLVTGKDKVARFKKVKIDGVDGANNPAVVKGEAVSTTYWEFAKPKTTPTVDAEKDANRVFDKVANAVKALDKMEDLSSNDAAMLIELKALMARFNRTVVTTNEVSTAAPTRHSTLEAPVVAESQDESN